MSHGLAGGVFGEILVGEAVGPPLSLMQVVGRLDYPARRVGRAAVGGCRRPGQNDLSGRSHSGHEIVAFQGRYAVQVRSVPHQPRVGAGPGRKLPFHHAHGVHHVILRTGNTGGRANIDP